MLHGKIRRAKCKKRYKEIEPRTQLPGYLWAGEKKGMQRQGLGVGIWMKIIDTGRAKEQGSRCYSTGDKGTLRRLMLEREKLNRTVLKEQEVFAEEVKEEVMEWCRELGRKRRDVQNPENKLQGTVLKKDSAIRN